MSYFMRYISTDSASMSIDLIEAALSASDPKYSVRRLTNCVGDSGELRYGRALYAILDIVNNADDECEDIKELRSLVNAADADVSYRVLQSFDRWTSLLTLEVKFQGRSRERTLVKLDPLWDWLVENRRGLIHADGEGFYEGTDLILDTSLTPRPRRRTIPCPHCSKPLRTELAKQCFECGADWHSPTNG